MQQNRTILAVDSDNFTDIAIRYTQNAENAFLIAELNGMDVDSEIPSGTEIMLPLQSEVSVTVASPQTTTAEPTASALLELLKQHAGTIASTQQLGHVRSGSQIRVNEDGTMEVIGGGNGSDGVGIANVVDNQDGTMTIVLTDESTYTIELPDGQDGVGIANVVDNQDGTMTIVLTDESTHVVELPAGQQGEQGEPGHDAPAPILLDLVLLAANWVNNSQTLIINGVTETSIQNVVLSRVNGDRWANSNIYPESQAVNSITFSCETVPADNIDFKLIINP